MSKILRKAIIYATLTLMMLSQFATGTPAHASGVIAVGSNQAIFVDGQHMPLTAYNINGNNYVRLRDVGYVIGFEVLYDDKDDRVRIFTDKPYSGGLPIIGQAQEQAEATMSRQSIYVDGFKAQINAYSICGNNYTKLRDIGAAVNFSVEWDASQKRVIIDSEKPCAPEPHQTTETAVLENTTPVTDIPGGTAVDYSLEANPAIFDCYYTREKYNTDRQRVLDTGTTVYWGTNRQPQSSETINTASCLVDSLANLPDPAKVRSINDFLCAHLEYRTGTAFSGETFWRGTAYGVCEDYSRMFQYMCYRTGLPCLYITGKLSAAVITGSHAWNEVNIDGNWYMYDGTLSHSRATIIIGNATEMADAGYNYTDKNPQLTKYYKEVYLPCSTL